MIIDEYQTLQDRAEGSYKEKGSRFIAVAVPVGSLEEVKQHLEHVRKTYHDARHHCYAYRIGAEPYEIRYNDDGEPSGTAGKPIYGQIQSYKLTNLLIIVVRYFGGIKLGTGGLIQAYKTAAKDAISNGTIVSKLWNSRIKVSFGYEQMSHVMSILKEEDLHPLTQDFSLECNIILEIRKSEVEILIKKFQKVEKVACSLI